MHKYEWAVNKAKLTQSVMAVEAKKKLDPRIVVNEETIKLEYIARAGLLAGYQPTTTVREVNGQKVKSTHYPEQPTPAELEAQVKEEAEEKKAEEARIAAENEVNELEAKKEKKAKKDKDE